MLCEQLGMMVGAGIGQVWTKVNVKVQTGLAMVRMLNCYLSGSQQQRLRQERLLQDTGRKGGKFVVPKPRKGSYDLKFKEEDGSAIGGSLVQREENTKEKEILLVVEVPQEDIEEDVEGKEADDDVRLTKTADTWEHRLWRNLHQPSGVPYQPENRLRMSIEQRFQDSWISPSQMYREVHGLLGSDLKK